MDDFILGEEDSIDMDRIRELARYGVPPESRAVVWKCLLSDEIHESQQDDRNKKKQWMKLVQRLDEELGTDWSDNNKSSSDSNKPLNTINEFGSLHQLRQRIRLQIKRIARRLSTHFVSYKHETKKALTSSTTTSTSFNISTSQQLPQSQPQQSLQQVLDSGVLSSNNIQDNENNNENKEKNDNNNNNNNNIIINNNSEDSILINNDEPILSNHTMVIVGSDNNVDILQKEPIVQNALEMVSNTKNVKMDDEQRNVYDSILEIIEKRLVIGNEIVQTESSLWELRLVLERLERVLLAHLILNLDISYEPGIVSLVLPFVAVIPEDHEAFNCLQSLQSMMSLANEQQPYTESQFLTLFRAIYPDLHSYFDEEEINPRDWVSSWLKWLLAKELPLFCITRLWDSYFADGLSLHIYVCLAIVGEWHDELTELEDVELKGFLQHLPSMDIDKIIRLAYNIQAEAHARGLV